ncbi:MAG: phosphoribosylglycinamide formyltransferase [Deltaproteobacteria bacterium]|nr:phosphoribosylglycinamide formyltransferase [Deltaproteobacteria bacterium]
MNKINLGILVSGSGTNLQSIIDNCKSDRIDALVKVVISDSPEAFAIERAKKNNIDTVTVVRSEFDSRKSFEKKIVEILQSHKVELVCLAGFMRIIGKTLLGAYPNRIINIHPALLPSFPGLDGQKQAYDYGVKIAGCTMHFVDDKVDHGPIICQSSVPVMEDDTPQTLKDRILEEEHRIYPQAIQLYAEGKLKIKNRRVYILNESDKG